MFWIALVCGGVWLASQILLIAGVVSSLLHKKNNRPMTMSAHEFPPVSILKPVCGLEDGLEENLSSFFHLQYPQFELIFCIADPQDPAKPVIDKLIRQFPQVSAVLRVCEAKVGKNPKINNIYWGYKNCRFSVVLISDSNIRVERDYLRTMVALLRGKVGVVTSTIAGVGASSLGAKLESVYLNTFLVRWIYLSNRLGNPLVMGKSMLFRKRDLEKCGDIEALANVIAEDYATSVLMRLRGFQVAVMSSPVSQYLGSFSIRAFWLRHIRWGRIRKVCEYPLFLVEPLASTFVSGFCGAISFQQLLGGEPWMFFIVHLLGAFSLEFALAMRQASTRGLTVMAYWLILELMTVPLWMVALCGNTISWRGNRLRLYAGGRL